MSFQEQAENEICICSVADTSPHAIWCEPKAQSLTALHNQEMEAVLEQVIGKDEEIKLVRKPTHGTCCTCQDCGLPYDECKCDTIWLRNEWRAEQRAALTRIRSEEVGK